MNRKPQGAQAQTLDDLSSRIEGLEWEWDGYGHADNQYLVFTGDGQDGPCCGMIRPDGTIAWLVEA